MYELVLVDAAAHVAPEAAAEADEAAPVPSPAAAPDAVTAQDAAAWLVQPNGVMLDS